MKGLIWLHPIFAGTWAALFASLYQCSSFTCWKAWRMACIELI